MTTEQASRPLAVQDLTVVDLDSHTGPGSEELLEYLDDSDPAKRMIRNAGHVNSEVLTKTRVSPPFPNTPDGTDDDPANAYADGDVALAHDGAPGARLRRGRRRQPPAGAVEYIIPTEQVPTAEDWFPDDEDEWEPLFVPGTSALHAWVHANNPAGVFHHSNPRKQFSPADCLDH